VASSVLDDIEGLAKKKKSMQHLLQVRVFVLLFVLGF
jgi:hypothetical protein